MTRILGLAVILVSTCVAAGETRTCPSQPTTQADLNACADVSYRKAVTELARIHRQLRVLHKNDSAFLDALDASDRAWLSYRDAQLRLLYPSRTDASYYGSTHPMCESGYLEHLARLRIEELRAWLVEPAEGDICAGTLRP